MWANLLVTGGRKLTPPGCGSEALGCIGGGLEKESERETDPVRSSWRQDQGGNHKLQQHCSLVASLTECSYEKKRPSCLATT